MVNEIECYILVGEDKKVNIIIKMEYDEMVMAAKSE